MGAGQNTYEGADAGKVRQNNQNAQDVAAYEEILQRFRLRLSKEPRNVKLLNEVGMAAEKVGDIDRALWAYKRAIRLDPGYAESYRNLGLLYRKEGRAEPAQEAMQKYVRWGGDKAELPAPQEATGQAGEGRAAEPDQTLDEKPIYTRLNQVWDEMGLTPAEAMMLLDVESSGGLKMMQYTLLDLIARGILQADDRLRVGRGDKYGKTTLAPHEALFAKYFSRIADYVDIYSLAGAVLTELSDDGDAFKAAFVQRSLLRKGYLKLERRRTGGLFPVQYPVLSKKGIRARGRLERLLGEAHKHLARSLTNDSQQANNYVATGGPALLLMDAYPSRHFKRWRQMLSRMDFGPASRKMKGKARKLSLGSYIQEILEVLLGE